MSANANVWAIAITWWFHIDLVLLFVDFVMKKGAR